MNELCEKGLLELADLLEDGGVSCREVTLAFLDRIESVEDRVGGFILLRPDDALREAEAADSARANGRSLGPFHGIPIAIKDNLVCRDFETTCGSKILRGFRSPYDATVVRRLRESGLVILGTANMDEFAMGSSTENSSLRPTRNPWDLSRVPGGSSGGPAALVVAREAPVALGSDTGGSIRQPAALCGVVGVKPTYGRVSRYGLVAFASSTDQIGPLGRTVGDCAALLGVIAGHDPRDSTSVTVDVPDFASAVTGSVEGLRVGVPREFFVEDGVDPQTLELVREAIREIERAGARAVEVSLPHSAHGIAAYYLICTAEASSNLMRFDGVKYGFRAPSGDLAEMYERTRSEGFGAEVKRRIMLGTFVLSAGYYDAYYRKAQQVRTLIRRDYDQAFAACDLLATPTAPGPAWPLGERLDDPLQMYLSDIFTVSVNLAGLPAISVPCGFTDANLPVGLQLIGRSLDEETLFRVAGSYQSRTDWHRRIPEV